MTNVIGDRIEPGFFEADDEGYIQTPEEPGPGGKAQGIEFVLYIQTPDKTLKHYGCAAGFEFTEDELASWLTWMAEQYPGIDFRGNGENLEASVYDDYRDDEDTNALMMRLTVNNPVYNKLRDRWMIFYHGLEDYITHCKAKREEVTDAD